MHTLKSGTIKVHFNQDWSGRIILFDSQSGIETFHDGKPFRELAEKIVEYSQGEIDQRSVDFFFLLGKCAAVCEAATGHRPEDYCQNLATQQVSWSDRSMFVCDQHLGLAKHIASTDGEEDRDDNPIVHPVELNRLVALYWPEFQKSYYIDAVRSVQKRTPKRRLIIEEDFNAIDCGSCTRCNGASDEGFSCDLLNEPLKAPAEDMEAPFRHRLCLLLDEDEEVRERARSMKP